MTKCKVCFASNPDTAVVCSVCKATLDRPSANPPVRRPTVPEFTSEMPVRRATVFEDASAAPPAEKAPPVPATPQRRVTVFDPSALGTAARSAAAPLNDLPKPPAAAAGDAQPKPPVSAAGRKIVGVLITYSWSDQGQIFPVYEGRNRIGSDPVQCDIVIPQDDTLSAINSHIVFRKSFTIGDDVSMGGTDLDGEPVEVAFVPLRNYARIRAGSTHFTFIAVQPPTESQ
jgi:Inner membrane component of T3SS, cytoplasmic domain